MRPLILTPKISYTLEVEIDESIEVEVNLNFPEVESYLKKTLFQLRHRAIHAGEENNEVAIRISIIAHNPNV